MNMYDSVTLARLYVQEYLGAKESILQQQVDEEGCGAVFVALKIPIWEKLDASVRNR